MTDYELAQLRLQAFALLDGWGKPDEKGVFRPYDLEKRKALALEFIDWASTPGEPSPEQASQIIADVIDLKNKS